MNIQKCKKALLALLALPLMVSCGDDKNKQTLTNNFKSSLKTLLGRFVDSNGFKTTLSSEDTKLLLSEDTKKLIKQYNNYCKYILNDESNYISNEKADFKVSDKLDDAIAIK